MASFTWRVNNSTALGGEVCAPWQANHAYATGARCVCTIAYATVAARAVVFECTDDGTSHATTQPTWDYTVGNTTSDGTVTWTARSPSDGSWDNASCYLAYILNHTSINAATDTVLVDDGHSEAGDFGSARIILKGSTSAATPLRIYCVDKADDSISTGALVKSANGYYGPYLYYYGYSYGVTYELAGGNYECASTTGHWIFESDNAHHVLALASGKQITVGNNFNGTWAVTVINGGISFGGTGCYLLGYYGKFQWFGGYLTAASGVTKLIDSLYKPHPQWIIRDVDLSAVGSANALVDVADTGLTDVLFERCKLPSGGFVPAVGTWPDRVGGKVFLKHCSNGNATYEFYKSSYEGVIEDNTSIYRSGGASDGTTALSAKMVSSANCLENIVALDSIAITGWTSSTTAKTFTVEGVWDSATNIQDDEIWIEFEYPADSSSGLGAIAKDKCAVLGTPANQTASAETWTGTDGFSDENKFKLSVTVTPGKAGPICARVYLAKASTTVYIDPMITES